MIRKNITYDNGLIGFVCIDLLNMVFYYYEIFSLIYYFNINSIDFGFFWWHLIINFAHSLILAFYFLATAGLYYSIKNEYTIDTVQLLSRTWSMSYRFSIWGCYILFQGVSIFLLIHSLILENILFLTYFSITIFTSVLISFLIMVVPKLANALGHALLIFITFIAEISP